MLWQFVLSNHAAFNVSGGAILSELLKRQLLANERLLARKILEQALLLERSIAHSVSGELVEPAASRVSVWVLNAIPDFLEWVELFAPCRAIRLGLTIRSDLELVVGLGLKARKVGHNHRGLSRHLGQTHISRDHVANSHDVIIAVNGHILSPGICVLLILIHPT